MTAAVTRARPRTGASTGTRQRRRPASRNHRPSPATQDGRVASTPATATGGEALVPVTGILDVRDSFAFVRTSGYLPGPGDVYVSMTHIKKYGLRPGDEITGAARAGSGERNE